ncbi:MAG TPA: energy transducer TonB [Candidatus Angelobacter sp.]|nr:energy transducer TonB [Candidatus Angelobacter sp.]
MKLKTFLLSIALLTGINAMGQSTSNPPAGNAPPPAPGDDPTVPKPKISAAILDRDPHPAVAGTPAAVPEEGAVAQNVYSSKYFGLEVAFPSDWKEGYKGPKPSDSGYYVLASLRPQGEFNGNILIVAQDMFFYARPVRNSSEMLKDVKANLNEAQQAVSGPAELRISDHAFGRFDFTGAGLHFAQFATDIRCHVVSFVVTTRDPKVLEKLVQAISNLKISEAQAMAGDSSLPVCVKDYATGDNVIRKVDPEIVGPKYTQVPTRFIIGTDGKVKHIHVINAFPDQAKSVETALAQWELKPYKVNGKLVEVETGILFEFKPTDKQKPAAQPTQTSVK